MPGYGIFVVVGVAAAFIYGAFFLTRPATLSRAVIKTLFMAFLSVAFILLGASWVLVLALAASGLGDFLLALNKPAMLPLGVGAFLVCQVCYLAIFATHAATGAGGEPMLLRYLAIAAIGAVCIGFLVWMVPKLGAMRLPVVIYALAITAMASASMLLPWSAGPAMLGAAFFLVSDFVLGAELFALKPDAPARRITAPLVWGTYVAAQVFIVLGILRIGAA
jgi:uncharacterized membrane protein YhhN